MTQAGWSELQDPWLQRAASAEGPAPRRHDFASEHAQSRRLRGARGGAGEGLGLGEVANALASSNGSGGELD